MRRKRLFWQLFTANLVVVLGSLAALTWYTAHAVRGFYLDQTSTGLEARVRLVEDEMRRRIAGGEPGAVQALCRELGTVSRTRFTVLLPDGTVAGDSGSDPADMDNHVDRPEIRAALASGEGSALRYSYTLQGNHMYIAVPLREEGRLVGVLRGAVSLALLNRSLRSLYARLALGGLIVALAGSLATLWLARRISRPLDEIRRGAERFADGVFEPRLPVPDSSELAGLTEAMNRMAAQLDERIRTVLNQRNEQAAVLSSMVEGVLAVDTDENLIHMNRAAGRLLGADPATLPGSSLPEVVRNRDLQEFVALALASDQPVEGEITLLDREERSLQAHGAALRSATGRRIGAVVVLNDITRLRRLEKVRRDFVANVSHELKTPITAIKASVETLRDGAAGSPADAERFLALLARQAERLDAITEDLLLLARIEQKEEGETLRTERADVRTILDGAVQACAHRAGEKAVRIRLECEGALAALANPPLLEQAVVNLLDNAVKFSPEGQEVRVRARQDDREIRIEIEDRGPGIERRHLERIFERFYRVDPARSRSLGSTGLGLAIVKHIAVAHGGSVSAASAPGKGSTFSLRIPAA